jgi:hypothetical protein
MNIRREQLEMHFLEFLKQLQPKPAYRKLFAEVVLDLWKDRQVHAAAQYKAAQQKISALRERQGQLEEALIFRRVIGEATYREYADKLKEEMMIAEIEGQAAQLEDFDIEAALTFANFVMLNAATMWSESNLEQKQRLQHVLFPRGVTFADGVYRTEQTSLIFFELEREGTQKEGLVALTGIEPVF